MTCNFSEQSRVVIYLQQRIIVVGNGNIDVGKKTATRRDQPALDTGASERRIPQQQGGNCGAMSQQRGDSGRGNVSAPQKFVQLVGYRDPHTLDAKPRREPVKR
jgi:hypothetical protein